MQWHPSNRTTKRITFKGCSGSISDTQLKDKDGDTYTFWKVNITSQDTG